MLSKVLAPFPSDVITTQQYLLDRFPVVSSDLVHNGAIYGVPIDFDTLALFTDPKYLITKISICLQIGDHLYATAQSLTVKGTDGTITATARRLWEIYGDIKASDRHIFALLLADSNVDTAAVFAG